jgi:hypothetical protein
LRPGSSPQDLLKTAARTLSLLKKQVEKLIRISRRPLVLVAKFVSDGLHWRPSENAVVFTHGERAPGEMISAKTEESRKISSQPFDSIRINFDDYGSRMGQDTMTTGNNLRFSTLRDDFRGEWPCIITPM